jgi:quercetin dioxygenase-like cupin family protein
MGIIAICTMGGVVTTRAAGQVPPPAPVVVFHSAFPATLVGQYTIVTVVADVPPGGAVPEHYHSGPVVGTVLYGEVTLLRKAGPVPEETFVAGQSWIEEPRELTSFVNRSFQHAYALATYLVPKGAEPTTFIK